MLRLRLMGIAILLLLFTLGCGSSSTTTTTSGASSAATSAGADTSTATAVSAASTSLTAGSPATPDSSPGAQTGSPGNLKFTLKAGQSQASYKATEQLAGISSPSDAIGKTNQVSGDIVFDSTGAVVSNASIITIDLTTLTSDKSQRDNYIKRSTLSTDRYPDAVFVPTAVQGLTWPLPTSGSLQFTIVGNLTAHGVTKPTTWSATANFSPNQISGSATTTVKFEDFDMTPPRTMLVLSVEDHLTFELNFVFAPAS